MCKNMCLEYSLLGIPPTVVDFFFSLSLRSEKKHMHEVNAGTDWGVFTYGVTYMGEYMHEVIGTTGWGKYTRDGLHIPESTHIR